MLLQHMFCSIVQRDRIFFDKIHRVEERDCPQYRHATAFGEQLFSRSPEREVATKFIHDEPFDPSTFFGFQQHQRAQERGENTTSVNSTHKKHWSSGHLPD